MLIWQLISIQIVTFILIVLFLRQLLHAHIGRALRRLQKLNQENLEKRKALKEELEMAKKEIEGEIESGKREAESIKEQAGNEAEKNRQDVLAKVKKEAKRLISEAIRDAQRKKVELTLEMQRKAVHLATDMVKYIFTAQGRENLHIQLIDEVIDGIEDMEKEKLKIDGNQAEVIHAFSLPGEQKKRLKKVLDFKLNKEIVLVEKKDEEVIAGLIIKLKGVVIDGSIKNKLKKVLLVMKEEEKEVHSP